MATVVDDFVHKFHSLQGVTLAERRKNFFKLLHENATLKNNISALDNISANLQPRTYLEMLFRLDFLIYFRKTSELLQILKTGNDVFVSKIVKQTWFFTDAFKTIPAVEIVDEVLPSMSFVVRMKILRKLSRYADCEKFEAIYDGVAERYGVFIASQFITGCGPRKIRDILSKYPVKLTSTQLRILHEKDPTLIEFYFALPSNFIGSFQYKNFVRFIYNNDPALYDHLNAKNLLSVKLGRRTTKKFVEKNKDEIIKKPYQFRYLDMKAVVRKFGKDCVKLFTNDLPAATENYHIMGHWLFPSCSPRYHYSLFLKIFQSRYKMKLEDYPSLINEELLHIVPENSKRAQLAKVKVAKGQDEYIKYLLPEESIKLIKDKINVTSDIYDRGQLIKDLVETCYINNDLSALLTVMKYFCHRHKNDELQVHLRFINSIESRFGFKQFTEEMWSCLQELLIIHMLKFNQDDQTYRKVQTLPLVSFNQGTSARQKLSYLEYLFKKGDCIDELISEYLSTSETYPQYREYDKDFGKHFLLHAINQLSKSSTDSKQIGINYNLIVEIENWNAIYSDEPLSLYEFPNLIFTFNHVVRNYEYRYRYICDQFRSKIFTTIDNQHRQEYLEVYWNNSDFFMSIADIQWFLKYDPGIVVANFDKIFECLIREYSTASILQLWYKIKKHSHLQIDEKAIQTCLSKIHDEEYLETKPKLVPCLSVLMTSNDYAALANSFKPENKKLDLKNQKEVGLYNLQSVIAMNFKNTKCYEVLPALLPYCAGDYFKYALRSLYSLLYHTPEDKLPEHLNYLSTKAVSVRKHALYMTCELSTSNAVEQMLHVLNQQKDVQSLFSSTIQYFVKNPTHSIFKLVKMNMLFITKEDEESLNSIATHLRKIPDEYKAEFIQHAWEHFEKTVDVWEKLSPLKIGLLNCVDEKVAGLMSLEFGTRIIQQHFMTGDKELYQITTFIYNLLAATNEKEKLYATIFVIVDQCDNEKTVFDFLRGWYRNVMTKNGELQYFQPFLDYFEKKVTVVRHFRDYIRVFFLKIRLEHSSKRVSVSDVTVKLLSFFEEVIGNYGFSVIHLFATEMDINLKFFSMEEDTYTKTDFYYEMIKQSPTATVAVLLLSVLSEPARPSLMPTFNRILKQIQGVNDVGVQINLQCKFEHLLDENKIS